MGDAARPLDPARPLDGRVAVVTGGAAGIGAAVVRRFRDDGASVVAADVAFADGDHADTDDLRHVVCDVSDETQVEQLMRTAAERHGRIDLLLNVAGIARNTAGVEDISLDDWRSVLDVNLTGPFLCVKHALPHLRASRSGAIVNVASIAAIRPIAPGSGAYAAAKAGLTGLTRQLVVELAPLGITVNTIAPGPVPTAMTAGGSEDWNRRLLDTVPLGRLGRADEIAACAAFLARDDARFVNGETLVVDGGLTSVTFSVAGQPAAQARSSGRSSEAAP